MGPGPVSFTHDRVDDKRIGTLIESEMINHFGIEIKQETIKEVVGKIFNFWKNK